MNIFVSALVKASIGVSMIMILLFLLGPLLNKRYTSKWRCLIWLALALRMIIPMDFHLIEGHELLKVPKFSASKVQAVNTEYTESSKEDITGVVTDGRSQRIGNAPTNKIIVSFGDVLALIWLWGAITFFLYQGLGYYRTRKTILRWSIPFHHEEMKRIYENLLHEMNIRRDIKLMVSHKVDSPMIMGLIHPILLLPHEKFEISELTYILRHELVHLKRHHILFKFILALANGLHWFNPLMYLVRQQAFKDIEICCDQEVVKYYSFEERKEYSATIIRTLSRHGVKRVAFTTCFNENKEVMKKRLKEILYMKRKTKGIMALIIVTMSIFITNEVVAYRQVSIERDNQIMKELDEVREVLVQMEKIQNEKLAERNVDKRADKEVTEMDLSKIDGDVIGNAVLSNDQNFIINYVNTGKADLNRKNSEGVYPLEMTIPFNNSEMAELLLANGADANKETVSGQTIYEKAMESDTKFFRNIFKKYNK